MSDEERIEPALHMERNRKRGKDGSVTQDMGLKVPRLDDNNGSVLLGFVQDHRPQHSR